MAIRKPATLDDLQKLAERSSTIVKRIEAIRGEYEAKSARIEADFANRLASMSPKNQSMVKPAFDDEKRAALKALRDAGEPTRGPLVVEMTEIREAVAATKSHLGDARVRASLHGIGSETRSRIEQSLATAGPAELKSMAFQAELLGDKDLAAVVIARVASLDSKYRPINPTEFANKLWSHDVAKVAEISKHVEIGSAKVIGVANFISGRGTTPTERMAIGLRHPGENILPRTVSLGPRSMSALEKLEAGLAAAE